MKNTNLILTGVATVGLTLSIVGASFAESPDNKESKPKAADNTARNERDRDDKNTQTPPDQGNSQTDIDTTAKIRREIVGTDNLSVNAKNIKIITNQGKVTLRGPVASNDEKKLIGEIAVKTAPKENVDNQLEVK